MTDPLFNPLYAEPIDLRDQVDRFPPNDAPCPEPECRFPFCLCYATDEENE
jgi:hypothetical protein